MICLRPRTHKTQPVFCWFFYLPLALVNVGDNEFDQVFLGTSSKGAFSIILFCSYSLKNSYVSTKFFDVQRFFNFLILGSHTEKLSSKNS